MILGIVLTVMTLTAAALVVIPLLRANRTAATRAAHEIEIYRDQLDEVDRDVERELISTDEAEAARAEIGRRMLAIDTVSAPDPDLDVALPKSRALFTAIATGLAVPMLAIAVYLVHGSPELPGRAAADPRAEATKTGADTNAGTSKQRTRVAELTDALEKNPAHLDNWVALGDALTDMRRHRRAAVAYTHAMQLAPANGDYASRAGEALAFAADGQVTPAAAAAFREALRREPGDARGQYYLGLADQQGGRLRAALDRWIALEAASPRDAPWLKFLRPRIARIATELGIDHTALAPLRDAKPNDARPRGAKPGDARGPSREQMEAARNMTADDRQTMIRNMVDGLAERLKDTPDDITGWLRLGRARGVLGEKVAAKAAYARAAALRPEDIEILTAYADAIVEAASPAPAPAAELKPVVDRILARDADQPRALWLSGALALSAGDRATAKARWTKLLDFVDPNSARYIELKNQLNALKDD